MKHLISLVSKTSGIAKSSGNPYEMYSAISQTQFTPIDRGGRKVVGFGTISSELEVSSAFYPALEAAFQRDYKGLPVAYDFDVTLNGDGKLILLGFVSNSSLPKQ